MRFKLALTLNVALSMACATMADACSRLLYETGTGSFITARSMDWNDPTAATSIWTFPKGMERSGEIGDTPIKWTSKYGSVVTSFYNAATADGLNEKGLVGNALYLAEADYGDPALSGKPTLSVGAWLQYLLDNYATVEETVAAMQNPPFALVAPKLPNGRETSLHVSLSDKSGDSAILEYLDGQLVIHHGPEHQVMTNSPTYDQQLALNAYWDLIGGDKFLPGTISAADRFARVSYNLNASPKYEDRTLAVASVFSQIRAISVPLGMNDPELPNISATLWRIVVDHETQRFYFDSAVFPSVVWVDLDKVELNSGSAPMEIKIDPLNPLVGNVSDQFIKAKPFEWLK